MFEGNAAVMLHKSHDTTGYFVTVDDKRVGFVAHAVPRGWESRLYGADRWECDGVWRTRAAAVRHILRVHNAEKVDPIADAGR